MSKRNDKGLTLMCSQLWRTNCCRALAVKGVKCDIVGSFCVLFASHSLLSSLSIKNSSYLSFSKIGRWQEFTNNYNSQMKEYDLYVWSHSQHPAKERGLLYDPYPCPSWPSKIHALPVLPLGKLPESGNTGIAYVLEGDGGCGLGSQKRLFFHFKVGGSLRVTL